MAPVRTFIFAGGGTGGHLYPGLAIAESLNRIAAGSGGTSRSVFVCSDRPLDSQVLAREDAEFVASPAKPIVMSVRGLARFVGSWGPALRQTRALIRAERAKTDCTVHVVAMGGFVAAPAVQAARVENTPITMVNLDAVPGKANRWIASRIVRDNRGRGGRVISATVIRGDYAPRASGWLVVPPIVRERAIAKDGRVECVRALGLDPGRRTLMVTGGSQGARSLNEFVAAFIGTPEDSPSNPHAKITRSWQVIHQCGRGERERLIGAYRAAGVPAVVEEFVTDMSRWWGAADLAVARAGAGNVGEAWANRVPTVFMPYPFHKDEHQKYNAATLVEHGAAWLVRDHVDVARNLHEAGALVSRVMTGQEMDAARAAFESLGPADGAERIAQALWASS